MIRKAKREVGVVEQLRDVIRREMESQHVSASELARRASVGRPYLHRVLAGQQSPNVEWAAKVLAELGVGIDFPKIN